MTRLVFKSAVLAASLLASPAIAQPGAPADTFLRVGATHIELADKGKIFINGTQDPAADYETPGKWVASAELGYFALEHVAVQVSGTTPARTSNVPSGSLTGIPDLGSDKFSIFTLTGTYHPLRGGVVSPYVGAGVGLQKVWSTRDGFSSNLEINDAFGPVIQAGVELGLGDRFGVFVDAKKGFWTAKASADLGPTRVTADAKLDPVLLQAGALIRF